MSPIDTLFVDKGGVLIDSADDLGPQWRRLIGEFLSPLLAVLRKRGARRTGPRSSGSWNASAPRAPTGAEPTFAVSS